MQLFPRSRSDADDAGSDAPRTTPVERSRPSGATSLGTTTTVAATSPTTRRQLTLRPPVGLHLSSDALRACQLRRSGDPITGSVALEPGAIVDGEIRDAAAVADALRQLWADSKFTTRRVVVGVSNQDVVTRQIEVPPMNDRDMRHALAFELQSAIPFPPSESQLDFQRIETVSGSMQPTAERVLAIAALRSMTRSVITTLGAAKLRVESIDLVPVALVRAVNGDVTEDTHAIVYLGSDSITITVHNDDRVRFARTVMTPSVASSLSGEIEHQLSEFSELWDTTAGDEARARSTSTNPLVRAIEGTLEYYESQDGAPPIERLTVVGDLRVGSTLAPSLHQALQTPISLASPLHSEPITDGHAVEDAMADAHFIAAYGLALDPSRGGPPRPTLLPPPENPDDPKDLVRRGLAALVVSATLAFGLTSAVGPDATAVEAELAAAQDQLNDDDAAFEGLTEAFDDATERDMLADVEADATEGEVRWSELIRAIEDAAPAGASLLAVRSTTDIDDEDATVTDDEDGPAAIGLIEITGQSVGQSTIGAWMSALESVPGVRDPLLSNAATTQDIDNSEFTSFSITMTIDETATAAFPANEDQG